MSARNHSFGSDNHTYVHPKIMDAIVAANNGTAASYEMDDLSQELKKLLKSTLGCMSSYLVFNGTAANVLSLSTAIDSYHSVLCTDISHLNVDECNAPEKFTGCKLVTSPHAEGKLRLDAISSHWTRRGDQHSSQLKAVSLTQPSEYGTVYTLEELKNFRDLCREKKLILHFDGARLANAAIHLNCSLKDLVQLADIVSFGGTKNGLLGAELVLINSPQLDENFKFLRKQACQLPSKTRFMSAQFLAYFKNDLWREIAHHQCQMASLLAEKISSLPGVTITQPVQSNAVFCLLPQKVIKPLKDEFFFYIWNELTYECRLMTSFSTQRDDVERFAKKLEQLITITAERI